MQLTPPALPVYIPRSPFFQIPEVRELQGSSHLPSKTAETTAAGFRSDLAARSEEKAAPTLCPAPPGTAPPEMFCRSAGVAESKGIL